ncbi:MAG: hypothetical protein KC996_05290, partial [Phycisphaerales bacterium]|nr:hypothetical protein [Phycisphaerales bacterium]
VVLPRFVQSVDNGILNSRLVESSYDRPRLVPVKLSAPGPGGGDSETRVFNIAAPIPVASSVEPNQIEPGGELQPGETGVMIHVRGPEHVPYWQGYEEPKFGNFNADSVIVFDGVSLATDYFGPSELRAVVPTSLVQTPRRVHVEVYTPSNGTAYLERLVDGNGNVVKFVEVESGGTSVPLAFDIKYRVPEIHELHPAITEQQSPAFDIYPASTDDPYNFKVRGDNFRPGAVVLINGVPRETEFVSRGLLRARLTPADVYYPGYHTITVQNPAPSNDVSEEAVFQVVPKKFSLQQHK